MHAPPVTTTRVVTGHDGIRLHVREGGDPDGPAVLFVHGWSQSSLCWEHQFEGGLAARFRLVGFDLRGHGMSDAPADPAQYATPAAWAGDLAAVIDQLELDRPVVVAWSYGGIVVTDYLRAEGDAQVAGIDLVGAAISLGQSTRLGGPLVDNVAALTAPDLAGIVDALPRFLRGCSEQPLSDEDWSRALVWNMAVRPDVRGSLVARQADGRDALAAVTVPVLVTHGRQDRIIPPSTAEEVLRTCRTARASWYDGVGHMPFLEDTERFDRELAALRDEV